MSSTTLKPMHFRPLNGVRIVVWSGFALLLLLLPLLARSNFVLTLVCAMGIASIACMSYNMLLGQAGIEALVFNEHAQSALGEIPFTHASPELWVAEDRDLLSSDPIYSNYYSVTGLFNRLREDAGRHPDTMNQRYGAWSQLLTLFRLIYEGGQHGDFRLPARKGYLFDPDRYPFLEGRSSSTDAAPIVPRVSVRSPSMASACGG